jgi:hypothetical protein
MPSRAVSLRRLRSYEDICRQSASCETSEALRAEFLKFADTFRQVAKDLEPSENELAPA